MTTPGLAAFKADDEDATDRVDWRTLVVKGAKAKAAQSQDKVQTNLHSMFFDDGVGKPSRYWLLSVMGNQDKLTVVDRQR